MSNSPNKSTSSLQGKVCLVTGASSGIGLACALNLVENGAIVYTAQRTKADCAESNDILKFIHADFEDENTPEKVISEIIHKEGKLDILINNAGLMQEGTAEEMSLETWEKTLRVNLTAPFLLIKHAITHLRKSKGSIVNIGSIEGLASNPKHSAYCASKAGVHGLTRAVAVDYGNDGIRCNAVAPGWIDTPLNIDFIESMPDPKGFKEKIGDIHPIGRTGKPEEVAKLVAWLASDEASFITGQIMTIDGGRTAKLSLP